MIAEVYQERFSVGDRMNIITDSILNVVDVEVDPEDPVYYNVSIISKEGEDNEQKI